jgi:hypothetical protein
MAGATLQEILLGLDELRDGRLRKYLCDETPERKVGFRVWVDGEEVPGDRVSVVLKDAHEIEVAPFPLAAGKAGVLWKMDRQTGEFLGFKEMVKQTVWERIDPKTGVPTYRPDVFEMQ